MSDNFRPLSCVWTESPDDQQAEEATSIGETVSSAVGQISKRLHDKYVPQESYLVSAPYDKVWASTVERLQRRCARKMRHIGIASIPDHFSLYTNIRAKYDPLTNRLSADLKVRWLPDLHDLRSRRVRSGSEGDSDFPEYTHFTLRARFRDADAFTVPESDQEEVETRGIRRHLDHLMSEGKNVLRRCL